MQKIHNLIEKLCPNGVEYKTIGELFDVKNGYTPSKNNKYFWENGNIPWFRMDDIRTNGNILNDATQHITELAIKNRKFPKDSLIVATTATIGVHALIKCDFVCNQQLTCVAIKEKFKNDLNIKFCFYYFDIIDEQCKKIANQGGGMPIVSLEKMKKLVFPVPPLEVQCEIVHILDDFTLLSAELSAELEARKRQYCYYREKLFEFNNDGELKTMGELFPFIRNGFVGTIRPFFTDEKNGIRYLEGTNIHNGIISDNEMIYVTKEFHQRHKKNELKEDDILMVQSGHIGECAVVGKKYKGANCHALIIMSNGGECLSKYIVHYFHTLKGFKALNPAITGGTIKHVLAGKIYKIKVPCPPIEEQTKIVNILDKLEKLCNDISEGLPAEIEARQKQYEYYRDKLLTFKELKVNE